MSFLCKKFFIGKNKKMAIFLHKKGGVYVYMRRCKSEGGESEKRRLSTILAWFWAKKRKYC